jgi:RNase P/RNase MRP subunit p30
MDIVRFVPDGREGAGRALPVSSLSFFFDAANALAAKQSCRKKGALVHPSSYGIDDGDLLELSRAGGAVVFSFSDVLSERGFRRSILISKMRLLLSACRKRKTGFIFATLAKDASQMRSGRELVAFAAVLGATDLERKEAEKRSLGIAERGANPKKLAPSGPELVEK